MKKSEQKAKKRAEQLADEVERLAIEASRMEVALMMAPLIKKWTQEAKGLRANHTNPMRAEALMGCAGELIELFLLCNPDFDIREYMNKGDPA